MKNLSWSAVLCLLVLCLFAATAFAQAPARPAITGISHIAVYASDIAAAEHYYVHDIGLKKGPDPENPAGARYYVNPKQFVEVLPLPANAGNARLDHIGYITANAEALRNYLAAHNYTVPAHIEKASDGSRWFDVKDPEGNTIQFLQPAPHPISMAGADPVGLHIIHVGYRVKSADAENAFYRDLLGFRPYWHGGMKPDHTDWVSQQVPNGHDWLEYMLVATGDVSQQEYGVLDHLSIGVVNMEKAVTTLDTGRPTKQPALAHADWPRRQVAIQPLRRRRNTSRADGVHPGRKALLLSLHRAQPLAHRGLIASPEARASLFRRADVGVDGRPSVRHLARRSSLLDSP